GPCRRRRSPAISRATRSPISPVMTRRTARAGSPCTTGVPPISRAQVPTTTSTGARRMAGDSPRARSRSSIWGRGPWRGHRRRRLSRCPWARRTEHAVRDGLMIIDADGHLAEPAAVFEGRIDERHLELAPRILRTDDGRQGLSFLGRPPAVGMFGSGDAIVPGGIQHPQYRDWDDGDPGAFDPRERLREMDAEGVDVSVLFPTLGLFAPLVPDPDAEAAYCMALNDFYAEFCSADPVRLRGVAMLPLKDVGAAVREVGRAAERGFVAVCLRPNPDPHTRQQVADARLEPVWHAIEEAGMAACF